jgi:hypothetical protein
MNATRELSRLELDQASVARIAKRFSRHPRDNSVTQIDTKLVKPTGKFYVIHRTDAFLLESQIDDLARAISRHWSDMSPDGKTRALALEKCLSEIRTQII